MNNMPDRNSAYGEPLDDSEMDEEISDYDYPGDYRADYNGEDELDEYPGDDEFDEYRWDEDEDYPYSDSAVFENYYEPTRMERIPGNWSYLKWSVKDKILRLFRRHPNSDDIPF